jgi:Ca2+-binding EF-hand superfamily protein
MDSDGDGQISQQEITDLLSSNPAYHDTELKTHLQQLFELVDFNHNGRVDWAELLEAATHHKLVEKEERLLRTFKQIDVDDDGKASADELVNALGIERAEIEHLIAEV